MNYPQLDTQPRFIFISIGALFGLLIIIVAYYIIVNKTSSSDAYRKLYGSNDYTLPSTTLQQSTPTSSLNSTNTKNATYPEPVISPINSKNNNSTSGASVSASSLLLTDGPKQVYNIKENIYEFGDAEAVCSAFGGELATIEQLVEAHKNGADWCNVGWTKEGLAAYPIQQKTWEKLQNNEPNKRNICGVPGINLVRNSPSLL